MTDPKQNQNSEQELTSNVPYREAYQRGYAACERELTNEVIVECLDWIHDELLDECESLEDARLAIVTKTIKLLED